MPVDAPLFSIGRVAERFGLRPSAIHFYEKMGLLQPAKRSPSGHRLYGAQDIRRMELIMAARELGCTLAETWEVIKLDHSRRLQVAPPPLLAYQALLKRKRQALRRLERAVASLDDPGGKDR